MGYPVSILLALALVAGCGIKPASHKSDFSYRWKSEAQNCETGNHSFSSKEEYCKGLLDEELNNHCAQDSRKVDYTDNCTKT